MAAFHKFKFKIEGDDSPVFDGITDGILWNGWEKPWIIDDQVEALVHAMPDSFQFNDDGELCYLDEYGTDETRSYGGSIQTEPIPLENMQYEGKTYINVACGLIWDEYNDMACPDCGGYFCTDDPKQYYRPLCKGELL